LRMAVESGFTDLGPVLIKPVVGDERVAMIERISKGVDDRDHGRQVLFSSLSSRAAARILPGPGDGGVESWLLNGSHLRGCMLDRRAIVAMLGGVDVSGHDFIS
jgi:hypothetical protein